MISTVDVAIVGGGIVGLATALGVLKRDPSRSVAVVEKMPGWAGHQTGRNSGVIHSGIYYRPGSLKAELCVEGRDRMLRFCEEEDIPFSVCGKLIVATDPSELDRLDELARRAAANGVPAEVLGPQGARDLEPNLRCIQALHVRSTGIVDFGKVTDAMARRAEEAGVTALLRHEVAAIHEGDGEVVLETNKGELRARQLVNCAGLQSDRVARFGGAQVTTRIVPFRGEYMEVHGASRDLVKGLIYPVPDPAFPFLGVHLTRGIDGVVHAGPNAVPGLSREGYRRGQVDGRDLVEAYWWPGFARLARQQWRQGIAEMRRSVSRKAFVASLQRLVPAIDAADLTPAPAGIRAQALTLEGSLLDDFLLVQSPRAVHVLNAPSPAATASLAIGDRIAAVALNGAS